MKSPRWRVRGAYKSSGQDCEVVVQARSKEVAQYLANAQGIVISDISPIDNVDASQAGALRPPKEPQILQENAAATDMQVRVVNVIRLDTWSVAKGVAEGLFLFWLCLLGLVAAVAVVLIVIGAVFSAITG